MHKRKLYGYDDHLTWIDVAIVGEQSLGEIFEWFSLCEQSWPIFFKIEGSFETNYNHKVLNPNLLSFRVLNKNPEVSKVPFPLLKHVARSFCSHRKGNPVKGCNDAAASFSSFSIGRDSAGFLDANTAWLCEHTLSLNSSILNKEKLETLNNVHRFELAELFLLSKKNDIFSFVVGFKPRALMNALEDEKSERGIMKAKLENLETKLIENKADRDAVPF